VPDDVREWQARPLVLEVRAGGPVRSKACYVAFGVSLEGERDVLGLSSQSSEGAKLATNLQLERRTAFLQDPLRRPTALTPTLGCRVEVGRGGV
jgi:transposase-like protein